MDRTPTPSDSASSLPVMGIGFTGHRDLASGLGESVGQSRELALGEAMKTLTQHLAQAWMRKGGTSLTWMSGLAEGADLIAAQAAMDCDHPMPIGWNPISPFAFEEFLRDHHKDLDRIQATSLWASGEYCVELNPELIRQGNDPEEQDFVRDAYAEVGDWLLDHANLLIAVVNPGQEDAGTGGSGWVWGQARKMGQPWIRIQFVDNQEPCIELSTSCGDALLLEDGVSIAPIVAKILDACLEAQKIDDGNHSHSSKSVEHGKWQTTESLFLSEKPTADHSWFARNYSSLFPQMEKWLAGRPGLSTSQDHAIPGAGKYDPLQSSYHAADQQAIYYNGLHRTTYACMYGFGFLAVLLAVAGTFVHQAPGHPATFATLLTLCELGTLAIVFGLYFASKQGHWRERGSDYRLLAELLRMPMYLRLLGHRLPLPSAPFFQDNRDSKGSVQDSWMASFVDKKLRQLAPVQTLSSAVNPGEVISFDDKRLRSISSHLQDSWLQNQIDYFNKTSARYGRLEHRLHKGLFLLFVLAVVACLSHIVPPDTWLIGSLSHYALLGTAAGPALAASLLGIASHAEWARLHRLYASRATNHQRSLAQLQKLGQDGASPLIRRAMATILKPLAVSSIREVADWRWLHAVHDPHLH